MTNNNAVWQKNGKQLTGRWLYQRSNDSFYIHLNERDPITGQARDFISDTDSPDFNGWKLVREKEGE